MVPVMTRNQYERQIRFPPIGGAGQQRIRAGTVFLAGCGAVGSCIAVLLVRAGVGRLVFCDRDIVEMTDLPRQSLFEHADAARGLPKVDAARQRLKRINPDVVLEAHAVDLNPENIEALIESADCVADGSDNFLLRFLLNDAALKKGVPWVYTGVIAATGHSMTIPAGGRPCLRCYIGDLPPEGAVATCASAGVIGPAVGYISSLAASEILRILAGHRPASAGRLTIADIWANTHRRTVVEADPECPACQKRHYRFLDGDRASQARVLCGSDSVQIAPAGPGLACSLDELAQRLGATGPVERGEFHLRFTHGDLSLTVFRDGRVIVSGTDDLAQARAFKDKYL
jgi:adenylyltransferase/sulfurtransferase